MSEAALTVRELINALLDKPMGAAVCIGRGVGPINKVTETKITDAGPYVVYLGRRET